MLRRSGMGTGACIMCVRCPALCLTRDVCLAAVTKQPLYVFGRQSGLFCGEKLENCIRV